MDDSIVFIAEVPANEDPVIISETRPKRKRKKIRTLIEEQQDEQEQSRQKLIKKRRNKVCSPAKITHVPLTKTRGIKRNINQIAEETPKTLKVEVGGAGCSKRTKIDDDIQIVFEWDPASVISERQGVSEWQARSVISLFDKENTLPFIARYRKEKTGNLEVEKLREIQNAYSQLKAVQEKVNKFMRKGDLLKKLAVDQKKCLLRATTTQEVEDVIAPLKRSKLATFAERARKLGLNDDAVRLLNIGITHNQVVNWEDTIFHHVDKNKEGLSSVQEVEQGIQYIIADIINKDMRVVDFVRNLMKQCRPLLKSHRKGQMTKSELKKGIVMPDENLCSKYKCYFDFKCYVDLVKPHQILAINRSEKQNVLSSKIEIPPIASNLFMEFCTQNFAVAEYQMYRYRMMISSIESCWERLVKPFMQRQIRTQLTEMAEIASVEVFTSNLKQLLMTPPIRGKTILAIDPGFTNGCKIAVTNSKGELLLTTTIFPFHRKGQRNQINWNEDHNAITLREIVHKHSCELFAIGNGTASRQMEQYLTFLISNDCFEPFNVQYTIINESGVSQYSVTPEAMAELPGLDPNHISAVSLARRLQDPLLEYVKVHPMHLGIGMYQHDIPEKLLHSSLDSVMIECVSFVGVDINVASEFVLRKLSGLSNTRAANIVEYRKKNGPIMNRQQLLNVKGIGPVTFEQCAGFIRILPETMELNTEGKTKSIKEFQKSGLCPLDRTLIHPESYDAAKRFMSLMDVKSADLGTKDFIQKVGNFTKKSSLDELANHFNTTVQTMQLIVEGLSLPIDFDMRAQFDKPLFRQGIMSMHDLTIGMTLTGNVQNVTHFGAFVDIGVGQCGLIPTRKMRGLKIELGSIVEVNVLSIEMESKRIALALERVLK